LINFVRLTVSDVQSTDQHDVREIVVNRHYISHLIRRYEHTVVHFGNGDRPINVRESPAEILTMEFVEAGAETSRPSSGPEGSQSGDNTR
jgi:hypothetical protein